MRFSLLLTCVPLILTLACGLAQFPAGISDLEAVDRIRNDEDLTPLEARAALADLGFDEISINALLRDVRLGNQFGGDLASAFMKVDGEMLGAMTPDEIQAYGDATAATTYSDAEAQEIADLFSQTPLNTAAEIEAFLDDPASELPPGIDEQNLRAVFIDFDPQDVLDDIP